MHCLSLVEAMDFLVSVLEMKTNFCCLLILGDISLICDVRNLHEKRKKSCYLRDDEIMGS